VNAVRGAPAWTTATVAALLFAAAACGAAGPQSGGGTPSSPSPASPPATTATSPIASPSPSPRASPLALEACGQVTHYQDGNAGPVLCPDGRPSSSADTYFRSLEPALAVLHLAPDATLDDVETALCADKTFAHMTNPIEESAYRLMAAEQGWRFGDEPVTWLVKQPC
jgi:hypothetical protein